MSYSVSGRSFDIRGRSRRVKKGDRGHATVVFVPKNVVGRIRARGARLKVFRRAGAREVYAYPKGGPYRIYSP